MKGILCIVTLLLAYGPLFTEAETNLDVYALSRFTILNHDYGFPGSLYYGRLLQAHTLMPDLFKMKDEMTDDALNEAIANRVHKNGQTLIFRLDDILKKRFEFMTFQNAMNTSGSTSIVTIPPPSKILPGYPPDLCTEAPMLHSEEAMNVDVCDNDPGTLHLSTMHMFNDFLMKQKANGFLAIAEEDESVLDIMKRSGEGGGLLGEMIRYTVKPTGYKKVASYNSFNIFGTLRSKEDLYEAEAHNEGDHKPRQLKGQDTDEKKPKVVICASFDTFSLLQSYRSPASNNSGLIAALEISRLLHGIDQRHYEVIVLLTSGSMYNFHGVTAFANSYADIDHVDLAVCLDDLNSRELYVYEGSKSKTISQMLQLHLAGSITDIFRRGISINSKTMSYQHEQFTRQKVHSITLTSSTDWRPMPLRQRAFEYKCNKEALLEHIINITQALAKAIQGREVPIDEEALKANIDLWEEKLAKPRCALTHDLHRNEGVREIVKHMRLILRDMNTQKVARKSHGMEFYVNEPLQVTFYASRPTLYHLLVFFSLCIYILMIWSLIRGSPKEVYHDIMKLLSEKQEKVTPPPTTSKSKDRTSSKYKIV